MGDIIFPHLNIHLHNIGKSIDVFGFPIAFYGMIIALGMLLGGSLVLYLAKKTGESEDAFLDLIIWCLVFAVIGARVYYVLFSWDYYKDDLISVFNLRGGGLAIYGGIIGGVITGYIVLRKKGIPFLRGADIAMCGVLVGQILGRWGNFFNREVFGGYTDNIFAMLLPINDIRSMSDVTEEMTANLVVIDGVEYISVHPTFLYESLWNLGVLIILLILFNRKKFDGEIFFGYLIGYGVGRFWIEGVRTDQLLLWNTSIPVSQLLSAILIVAGVIGEIILIKKYREKKTD